MRNNNLTKAEDLKPLVSTFMCKNLKKLDISYNNIGDNFIIYISNSKYLYNLKELILKNIGIENAESLKLFS